MTFNISKEKEWMSQYIKIWNEVGSLLFEKLAMEPIKGNNVRGKLKTWKKDIKKIFMVKCLHTMFIVLQRLY